LRVLTILGTRPEIIRLSRVIRCLDQHAEHLLLHTGQNYEDCLNEVFFRDLGIREPDLYLGVRSEGFGEQVGQMLSRIEPVFREHRPDRLLILGDTNSSLTAIVARRLGIPVFHLEAGNRCFDFRVPEEINRRILDHISTVLMPYTERSRENLLREGIPADRVFVTGNPIQEVMDHYSAQIRASAALSDCGVEEKKFFLVTMHRAENVDLPERLRSLVDALALLHQTYGFPVICSLHPRTRSRAGEHGIGLDRPGLQCVEPLGFFDFVRLEKAAFCVLTDSGTVQEETCILGVPNVTIRDVTERPETIECGSNVLAGCDPQTILGLVRLVTQQNRTWVPPPEYLASQVAATVCRIVLGFRMDSPPEPDRVPRDVSSLAGTGLV
jgi:UDP-N-acetylglucosamine 2-epimerase (non-hydrolysing)